MDEVALGRSQLGRYRLGETIGSDGMGTLHVGRYHGPVGFLRPVLIKSFYPMFAADPEFVRVIVRSARLAASVSQPNLVSTLDVVASGEVLYLVTDHVRGLSFARILRGGSSGRQLAPRRACSVVAGALHGLAAAHDLRSKRAPEGLVHGALCPETILVGFDGVPRITELGMSGMRDWMHTTREGRFRRCLAYTAPELARGEPLSKKSDIFAASAILWEALTGRPLFPGTNMTEVFESLLSMPIPSPREHAPGISEALEAAVMRGLARDVDARFSSAREMILALDAAGELAGGGELSVWAETLL